MLCTEYALKRLETKRPAIIAHRGASGHAPENTLFAARLAHAMGADMWELDTGLSRDFHLEVLHDDTLERTTNAARLPCFQNRAPYRLADFTHEELQMLDARGTWSPSYSSEPFQIRSTPVITTPDKTGALFKVPSLKEALLLTKELDWLVNIEIKDHAGQPGHAHVVPKTLELVCETAMEGRVLVSSFQHDYLHEARALLPELARAALFDADFRGDIPAACTACGARFCHIAVQLCNKSLVQALHQAHIAVNVWTVNTKEAMHACMRAGVDGIITNYPKRLAALVHAGCTI